MRTTIFVTDDDEAVRFTIARRLSHWNHQIQSFASGEALLAALDADNPDIIFLDLKMPGMSGIETLKQVRRKAPQCLVILLTAFGTVEDAVEAMKLGAFDFLIKSVDLATVEPVFQHTLDFLQLRRRVNFEVTMMAGRFDLKNLLAESPKMRELIAQVQYLTRTPKTTVLLQGETGTGKEFIARVLHHNGPRHEAPFVGINCMAIPQELFESELFGYERGAFTGAVHRRVGLCEQAEGGTLFLDEIGDLNLGMQAKLLRVLQERTVKRLGGRDEIEVDFRLIAATNRDLRQEVSQGNFREDLFFRLNVITLMLPPLRDRREDLIPLCHRILFKKSKELGKHLNKIDDEAIEILERYPFPGNVRELENIIERAVIFCKGNTLTAGDLPHELREGKDVLVTALSKESDKTRLRIEMALGQCTLADIEAAVIEQVMQGSDFNKSRAAKQLGLTRFALDRRLRKNNQEF